MKCDSLSILSSVHLESLSVLRTKNEYLVCSDVFNLHHEDDLGTVRKKSDSDTEYLEKNQKNIIFPV